MKLIIDIPEEVYKDIIIHNRERREGGKSAYYFEGLIQHGTPIPDNATNGDAVKTLFSNTFDNFCERTTWGWNRWWNTPYQKER